MGMETGVMLVERGLWSGQRHYYHDERRSSALSDTFKRARAQVTAEDQRPHATSSLQARAKSIAR